MSALLPLRPVAPIADRPGITLDPGRGAHSLAALVPAGRITELGGAGAVARTTSAVSILIRAQEEGETAVWIQPRGGTLFPPDLAEAGVDLDALVVVHAPEEAGPHGLARAAELLLRSGAFGVAVVDLTGGLPRGTGWLGRLAGLAREHASRVVLLTEGEEAAGSAGPLVGLRVVTRRERRAPGRFLLDHRVLRDRSGGVAPRAEARRGPWGAA